MKNYVQNGDDFPVTAPYACVPGQGVLVGNIFGIAKIAAAIGALVTITTRHVWNLAKKANDTPAQGDKLFWDDTNKVLTTTATGNKWVGVALLPALAADPTVRVRLNGFPQ